MPADAPTPETNRLHRLLGVFGYTRAALQLVWQTSAKLSLVFAALTLLAGLLPPALAWVSQRLIDAIVLARDTGAADDRTAALQWVGVEAGLIVLLAGANRGLDVANSLLRAQLGQRVREMILDKALTLSLAHFEDPAVYDQLQRARSQASNRPLSLVGRAIGLIRNGISLASYAALLVALSPLAVLALAVATLPAFLAETKYAGEAFRLFRWRSPETRMRAYLETLVAREDYAKEVQLYRLGPMLVERFRTIFRKVYAEDRDLTLRRGLWGFLLGLLGTGVLYAAYLWIAWQTISGPLSIGQMAMYLAVFKQGQSAMTAVLSAVGGMYEDNLYLSNLYEFLELEVDEASGDASEGPEPGDGLRFEGVGFTYPGADAPALQGVSLHLRPGQRLALVGHNGSGKTTLVKLMTRLYRPSHGRVTLDGLDLNDWSTEALRQRIGVIFQDFVRYQLAVGENIGAGDVRHIDDAERWQRAADKGLAAPFIEAMPEGYDTRLGRWFKDGRELSGGQWQKIALSRAFMREDADLLVLDEPTAAMDAEAEAEIFGRLAALTEQQMAVLISHRFSTVRMADHIVVLDEGRVVEQGDHDALVGADGLYARLFKLQARGYV